VRGSERRMAQARLGTGRRGGAGSGNDGARARKLFGLVELDPAGTVLYSRFEGDGAAPKGAAPSYAGLNFYTEVATFGNVGEFRNQLERFSRGSQPAHSMDFTCEYEDGPVYVRVLLARIRERSETDVTKSVLVHIRRAQ
jgi:hypothetical protein